MPSPPELIAQYLAGPEQLRSAIAGMTREQLAARPVAGKWTTMEVVAHLADFEPVYADRIRRVIALDRPLLLVADENEYVKRLGYHDRDLAEELALIEVTRKSTARVLKNAPTDAWQRCGIHSYKGIQTLEQVVAAIANHIPHHLPFIAEKRKALGV
jgi:uncharacterized damage-inducible protein DinB